MHFEWFRRAFRKKPIINENIGGILYRNISPQDSIEQLTQLINKAYKIYTDMGLNYVATN